MVEVPRWHVTGHWFPNDPWSGELELSEVQAGRPAARPLRDPRRTRLVETALYAQILSRQVVS